MDRQHIHRKSKFYIQPLGTFLYLRPVVLMERFKLFFAVINDIIPQVRWRHLKMKCWITLPTPRLILAKRPCYRRLKIDATFWSRYKHLHNKVYGMTRHDCKSYVDTITSHLDCSKKSFWSWINKLNAKADLFNNFVSVLQKNVATMNSEELLYFPKHKAFHLDSITVSPLEVVIYI